MIRKLRYLAKAKNKDDTDENDFVQGKMEGLVICNDNPWDLVYEEGKSNDIDMSEEENYIGNYVYHNIKVYHLYKMIWGKIWH